MTNIRTWINLVENTDHDREFYINQANKFRKERAKWWPVSKKLLANNYKDGSQTEKTADGTRVWYKNGEVHRDDDRPAIIYADGGLVWYKNGEYHRDGDKPARIDEDGTLGWWKNGKIHRDGDKPAVIGSDGLLVWYKNGQRHRVLGPAVIDKNNNFEWWFRGDEIPVNSQEEYEEWIHKNHPFDNEIKQLYY